MIVDGSLGVPSEICRRQLMLSRWRRCHTEGFDRVLVLEGGADTASQVVLVVSRGLVRCIQLVVMVLDVLGSLVCISHSCSASDTAWLIHPISD